MKDEGSATILCSLLIRLTAPPHSRQSGRTIFRSPPHNLYIKKEQRYSWMVNGQYHCEICSFPSEIFSCLKFHGVNPDEMFSCLKFHGVNPDEMFSCLKFYPVKPQQAGSNEVAVSQGEPRHSHSSLRGRQGKRRISRGKPSTQLPVPINHL